MVPSRKSQGLTLFEVLVVVAIVCIVAAIVFAAMGPSIRRARTASCVANVRQVVIATMQYAADSDGRYPFYLSLASTPSTRSVFFCPSDPYVREGGHWTYWMREIGQEPRSQTTYGYTFDLFGQLQYETMKDENVLVEDYPVLVLCLVHQPDPSPLGLAQGLDGPVVRGMRDGSVQVKSMKTKGVASEKLFGP